MTIFWLFYPLLHIDTYEKYKFFHNPIKIMIIFGKIRISCGHLLISVSISLYTKSGERGALIIYILTAFVPLR